MQEIASAGSAKQIEVIILMALTGALQVKYT